MEKKRLTTKNRNYIWWQYTSFAYFIGLTLMYQIDESDFDGLRTMLLFLFSAPVFSIISGYLAYKATERVFIPNLANVAIMILANLWRCLIEAGKLQDKYWSYAKLPYIEVLLEYIYVLLILALPIYIISVISSAVTKRVMRNRDKSLENNNIE